MKLKKLHLVFSFLVAILGIGHRAVAQVPATCFAIQSILVDACGSPEGENEMYRFQVGPNPILVSDIVITWPNNPFRGFCLDQVKLDSLNATVRGCGILISPPGGIVPAGKQVLVITSTAMNVAFNSFTNLSDTLYTIFQCAGNTAGHFVNYGTTGTIPRTLIMTDTATGCVDSVTYMKDSLTTQSGTHGAQDGAGVNFTYSGNASYYNNGCNAPFIAPSVNAGNDTTYAFCTAPPVISLHGTDIGGVRSVIWTGGHGTFSHPDSLVTTYTPSALDVSPIHLYLLGILCPDTLADTITITITPPVTTTQNISICQGGSYHIGTHTYTSAGTYSDTLLSTHSCDSIVSTHITVTTPLTLPLSFTSCGPLTYLGFTFTSSTTFSDTLRGVSGCDSLRLNISITIKNPTTHTQSVTICQGQSLTVGAHTHTTAGTYTDTLLIPNAAGCDSIVVTTLSITTPTAQVINLTGCNSLTYNGNTYTASTTVYDTVRTALGCDSIRHTVNITINSNVNRAQTLSICPGQSITVGTHTYTTTGVYRDTIALSGGCDSIIKTTLTVITATAQGITRSGCGQVIYNGVTYTANTSVLDTIRSTGGCDSIYITAQIVINTASAFSQTITVCQGQSYTVGTHTYTLTGTYIDTLSNVATCDSIVTTHLLNAGSGTSAGTDAVICRGDSTQLHASGGSSYTWTPATGLSNPNIANPYAHPTVTTTYTVTSPVTIGNQIVNGDFSAGNTGFTSGYTYTSTPPSAPCGTYGILGCEGYYTVNTNPANTHSQFASFGDHTTGSGDMFIVNGSTNPRISVWCQTVPVLPNTTYQFSAWVANVDIYPQPLPNLQFEINGYPIGTYFSPPITTGLWTEIAVTWNSGSSTSINICLNDSSSAAGGNDFALDDISFAQVCNGSDTVQIVVNPTYRDTVIASICRANGPYTLPNGTTTNVSGTYTSTFSTALSCDSVIVTRLTVDTTLTQPVNVPPACAQVTFAGVTYTSSTSFHQTLLYTNGCDSVNRTVNIVVTQTANSTQSPTICRGGTVTVGTHVHSATGTYTDTIQGGSVLGCDSIITTHLTVITPVTTPIPVSGTCAVTYQGQVYTANTTFTDTLRSHITGCDSVYQVVTITVIPVVPVTVPSSACILTGQSYQVGNRTVTTSGTYIDTVQTPGKCDSIYQVINLTVITPTHTYTRVDSCFRATYGGTTYTADTILTFTQPSALGCDSVISTDSIVIHSPSITLASSQVLPLVEGDSTILTIIPAGTYHNIVWTPDSNISSISVANPTVSPQVSTTYAVAAADSNNCHVAASINVPVTPNGEPDFVMPTAFSPNGDNMNDTFRPVLRAGSELISFHIYNRWGELVYDKDRDNSDGWNGFYKNASQPIGVYVYYITVKGVAGNIIKHEGNLTLLR